MTIAMFNKILRALSFAGGQAITGLENFGCGGECHGLTPDTA